MTNPIVNFLGEECQVLFGRYSANNQVMIRLISNVDGSPMCTASTCLPEIDFTFDGEADGEYTAIKDYSENSGILKALVEAGVVQESPLSISSGFVTIPVVRVLVDVSV